MRLVLIGSLLLGLSGNAFAAPPMCPNPVAGGTPTMVPCPNGMPMGAAPGAGGVGGGGNTNGGGTNNGALACTAALVTSPSAGGITLVQITDQQAAAPEELFQYAVRKVPRGGSTSAAGRPRAGGAQTAEYSCAKTRI